jgi:hypothetical protein
MANKLKMTRRNIIRLWLGAPTPIRQYKIQLNPDLWAAYLNVNKQFNPPSGASSIAMYTKADRVAFAELVEQELKKTNPILKPSEAY